MKGRLSKKVYKAEKSMNNEDYYIHWRSGEMVSRFKKTGSEQAPKSIDITLDKPYTLLIGNGGAIAIDESSEYWKQPGKIDRLISYFERFVQYPGAWGLKTEGELKTGDL